MHKGEIVQSGSYDELLQVGTKFSSLVSAHHKAISNMEIGTVSAIRSLADSMKQDPKRTATENEELDANPLLSPRKKDHDDDKPKEQLVKDEERERGQVALEVYWSYLTSVYKGSLVVVAYVAQTCFLVCPVLKA